VIAVNLIEKTINPVGTDRIYYVVLDVVGLKDLENVVARVGEVDEEHAALVPADMVDMDHQI
jgi:hypothetical protein